MMMNLFKVNFRFSTKVQKKFFFTSNMIKFTPLLTMKTTHRFSGLTRIPLRNMITSQEKKEDFENFMKDYEQNIKEAEEKIKDLVQALSTQPIDEGKVISLVSDLNALPIRFGMFTDLKSTFTQSNVIENIPLSSSNSLMNMLIFLDKLELDETEKIFMKIEPKYRRFINEGKFSLNDLSTVIYAYSKYQVLDKELWSRFHHALNGKISSLDITGTTKIFLAFAMAQTVNPELLPSSDFTNIYKQIASKIETDINKLSYLDTFRICISMTKRPLAINDLSQNVWKHLQSNFIENVEAFDLYQISQILLLMCETPYIDHNIFKSVEEDILKEYLEKIDELDKMDKRDMNMQGFLEDLSKISFSFALARHGSQYFWNSLMRTFIRYQKNISTLCLENLLFISYRLVDYLPNTSTGDNKHIDSLKLLSELFSFLEGKIISEKLLDGAIQIDPINAMMPFGRLGNTNEKIWNELTKAILDILNKHAINIYMLTDIIFAFSNYYSNVMLNEKEFDKGKNFFAKNFETFWKKIEENLLKIDPATIEIPHLGNIVIDLAQVNAPLDKTWNFLSNQIIEKINKLDVHNFIMILMGYSKIDYTNPELWKNFEKYIHQHISEFSLDELRKIVLSFLKNKEQSRNLWKIIEEIYSSVPILNKLDLDHFLDLQIPFALVGITNEKIWNKFEELVFKNLKLFKEDKDTFLNTVYSFSRHNKGSDMLWSKMFGFIAEDLNRYDLDDLAHISLCIKYLAERKSKFEHVLNSSFWENYFHNIEAKLDKAKLSTVNTLSKGLKENPFTRDNIKLIEKVDRRMQHLLKEVPK